jgi:type IV pilus biogenesis protein CpaD/CtpE
MTPAMRSSNHAFRRGKPALPIAHRSLRVVLLLAAALLAGCATANPAMEAAKKIDDDVEPVHCELYGLEQRLKRAEAGSMEAGALTAQIEERKALLKSYYKATMSEYIEVMKTLPREDRLEVIAWSHAVNERCAALTARQKSEGRSQTPAARE